MQVNIDGVDRRIWWKYESTGKNDKVADKLSGKTTPVVDSVDCYLSTVGEDSKILTGATYSSNTLKFEKETFRKKSLSKLIAKLNLDKAQRTAIWNTYFGRK